MYFDSVELGRAINNLIVNSYKHNKNNTRVYISIEKRDEKVRFSVADDGEPIEDKLATAIFDPFVSGSTSRSSEDGSGLGLPLSKKIAEKHGGKLYIDKNIGEYSKAFVIEI